jgi:hypothetical protein
MTRSTIRIVDRGADKVIARLQKKWTIEVGVIGEKGDTKHRGTPLTVAQLAEIHEYGLGVPQRSWLRGYLDENTPEINRVRSALWRQMIDLKISTETAANRLGAYLVGGIKKRIAAGIAPPNAPSTVRRKGSSKPLIDTGQLRSAINYRTEETD